MTLDDNLEGRTVGGYLLERLLGQGGMGQVYLGRAGRETVAIKVLQPYPVHDEDFRERFRREIAAARTVASTYTAAPLAFNPDDDPPWLATRYLPGLTLQRVLEVNGGGLPSAAVRVLAVHLAEALRAIHGAGVVHRDLTPGNIMVTPAGVRVIDFGLAVPPGPGFRTSGDRRPGTVEYLSPEQAGGKPVGAASDLYTLGAVVVFAATGRHPGPLSLSPATPELRRLADRTLRRAIEECLSWQPDRRPTAAALLDRLSDRPVRLSGTAWLPEHVAATIEEAAATPGAVHAPAPDRPRVPPDAPTSHELDPVGVPEPPARRRPSRRGLLGLGLGVGAPAVAAAVGWLAWPDPPPAPVDRAESRPSPSRSAPPPVASRHWSVRIGNVAPEIDVAGGLVLAWSDSGVHALDPGTGARRWGRTPVAGTDSGGSAVALADGSSPCRGTVAAGTAYFIDGAVYPLALWALRVSSGSVAWRTGMSSYPLSPVRMGGLLCFGTVQGPVRAIGAAGGGSRWSASVGAGYGLVGADGTLVAAGDTALTGLDAATGRRLWRYPVGGSAPILGDGLGYAGDGTGTLHAVRLDNGERAWRADVGVVGSLRYGDGVLYAATESGETYAMRAGGGGRLWTRRLGDGEGRAYGRSNLLGRSGRTLYVAATDRTVYALDAATGRILWTYPAGATLTTPPVATGGLVLVGTADGRVHALVPPGGDVGTA